MDRERGTGGGREKGREMYGGMTETKLRNFLNREMDNEERLGSKKSMELIIGSCRPTGQFVNSVNIGDRDRPFTAGWGV